MFGHSLFCLIFFQFTPFLSITAVTFLVLVYAVFYISVSHTIWPDNLQLGILKLPFSPASGLCSALSVMHSVISSMEMPRK